jgi:hypothetical protein
MIFCRMLINHCMHVSMAATGPPIALGLATGLTSAFTAGVTTGLAARLSIGIAAGLDARLSTNHLRLPWAASLPCPAVTMQAVVASR